MSQTLFGTSLINHPDFIEVTTEKKSIGIETIRELLHRLTLKPVSAPHIVVLIENAETMTIAAANALLKTLEEPPPYVIFFLLTTAPDQLLLTIRSRCQKVHFAGTIDLYRERSEQLLQAQPFIQEMLVPLLNKKKASFSECSKVAEALAKEGHDIAALMTCLQHLWHDALTWQYTAQETFLTLPSLQSLSRSLAQRSPEKLSTDVDLILETLHAIDGNVNKTLALERLFSQITLS